MWAGTQDCSYKRHGKLLIKNNILQCLWVRQVNSHLQQTPQQIPVEKTQHDRKIPKAVADDPHISDNIQHVTVFLTN